MKSLRQKSAGMHNVQSNCWFIISNKVYDVTAFLTMHPGGVSSILSYCGKVPTPAFQAKGGGGSNHSSFAYAMLPTYYVTWENWVRCSFGSYTHTESGP
jgi:cytochrome b involved in lipid metabolism